MHIFANRLVIEANCHLRYWVDVVWVVETIMCIVVTDWWYAGCKNIHQIKCSKGFQVTCSHEEVNHLKHINGMQFVVVFNALIISGKDLPDEANQLVLIQLRKFVHLQGLEDVVSQYRRGNISSKNFTEFQCVEIEVFHRLDLCFNIFLHQKLLIRWYRMNYWGFFHITDCLSKGEALSIGGVFRTVVINFV